MEFNLRHSANEFFDSHWHSFWQIYSGALYQEVGIRYLPRHLFYIELMMHEIDKTTTTKHLISREVKHFSEQLGIASIWLLSDKLQEEAIAGPDCVF